MVAYICGIQDMCTSVGRCVIKRSGDTCVYPGNVVMVVYKLCYTGNVVMVVYICVIQEM